VIDLKTIIADERTWYEIGSKGKYPDQPFLLWIRNQPCCHCQNTAVDGYRDIVPHHIRRVSIGHSSYSERSGKCGTSLKPDFCSVPLCVSCHDKVEGSGSDLAIADDEQWEVWRWYYPTVWAANVLLEQFKSDTYEETLSKIIDWYRETICPKERR
jgi:hypothetical protein